MVFVSLLALTVVLSLDATPSKSLLPVAATVVSTSAILAFSRAVGAPAPTTSAAETGKYEGLFYGLSQKVFHLATRSTILKFCVVSSFL